MELYNFLVRLRKQLKSLVEAARAHAALKQVNAILQGIHALLEKLSQVQAEGQDGGCNYDRSCQPRLCRWLRLCT
jgi:hypothetical protein